MVANLIDNEQTWLLDAEGGYTRVAPGEKHSTSIAIS
jgi:hypothetical protein